MYAVVRTNTFPRFFKCFLNSYERLLFFFFTHPAGLTEIIKFVKPAPIDQEMAKKAKKQAGGKKKKQEGDLPNAMETMSVNDS